MAFITPVMEHWPEREIATGLQNNSVNHIFFLNTKLSASILQQKICFGEQNQYQLFAYENNNT